MAYARDGTVTKYELTGGERSVVEEDVTLPDDPLVYGFGDVSSLERRLPRVRPRDRI